MSQSLYVSQHNLSLYEHRYGVGYKLLITVCCVSLVSQASCTVSCVSPASQALTVCVSC